MMDGGGQNKVIHGYGVQIDEEFRMLRNPNDWKQCTAQAMETPDNQKKNRYANVLPLNTNRVHLVEKQGETDYINASYITGPHRTKEYIATQGPLANTSSDFWLMILENNVTIVVMLTNVSENGMEKCHLYWPSTDEKIKRFTDSKVTVEFLSQEPIDVKNGIYWVQTKFYVSNGKLSSEITHLQYTMWPDHGVPSESAPLRKLVKHVEQLRELNPEGPICVHCSAGIGRSGTFIAVHLIMQKLRKYFKNHEDPFEAVNILETVQKLRTERPGMVQTKEQYIFCYLAVFEEIEEEWSFTSPDWFTKHKKQ